MVRTNPKLALIGLMIGIGGASSLLSAADVQAAKDGNAGIDAEIATLRQQRAELAALMYERTLKESKVWVDIDRLLKAAKRLLDAELALSDDPARQVAVLERHLGRIYYLNAEEHIAFRRGRIPISTNDLPTDYFVQDGLLRLRDVRLRLRKP
jgi:hypothetical protein